MRKSASTIVALSMVTMLSACGSSGIFDRQRPDEFAVSRQAPLVIPPDFTLVPPQNGALRPNATSAQEQVLSALFGGEAARSAVESGVINQAGDADAAIRSNVDDPETNTVAKGNVTRDIISAPEGAGRNAQATTPE